MAKVSTKVTWRFPSKAFSYGFAEMQIELPDDITPEQVAKMYVAAVLEYQLAELNAKEDSPTPEKAVEELFKTELGATKISEEPNSEGPAKAPWEKPAPATAEKPWESKAKVSLF